MDTGSTAWILAASMGVSLMIPGLALFYGGMTAARSTLNMMMMVFGAVAVAGIVWVLYGYSAVFGNSYGGLGLLGNLEEYAGSSQLLAEQSDATLPPALVASFQALFAAITVALIAGAVADRMRFGPWLAFSALWVTLVYLPVAHWVFAFDATDGSVVGGWIANQLKAVDYAGGTAVHINAGIASLAVVLVLGRRRSWARPERPHNLVSTMLGAGVLWFGWFGFNAGSALAAGNAASVVFLTTFAATCAAMLAWLLVEQLRDGHPTSLGAASGAIAGLVAITPSCGAVTPVGAMVIGLAAGAVCPFAVGLKRRFGYDDALDVVGVHLVGGILGTLLIGLLASPAAPNGRAGLFYGGGFALLGAQTVAAAAVLAYSFTVTLLIALALKATLGLRVSAEAEEDGVDHALHAETAYDLSPSLAVGGGSLPHPGVVALPETRTTTTTG
ncbi:ammonium transporter [Quadrisphaera granulorum]|uniref:Ammonium transporter n=1 Tax=Quadrisphaera granulorum TaxID=317664 RepID=A0A316A9A5_9ACTN|nr:ammonium transporter [Quadrisphaera granulorum]PWJ54335.1 ammonium transporter [Quadrisphaera granulorum]SZE96107.1 ammonium transporter [Quadrisphaera granulorum]